MNQKRSFAIGSLVAVLLFNAGMLAALLYLTGYPLLSGAPPDTAGWTLLGAALVISLLLWLVVVWLGGRAIDRAASQVLAQVQAAAPAAAVKPTEPTAVKEARPAPKPVPPAAAPPSHASAVQMLSILQREGRLIDFLQEDLSAYQDDQIGAAVRNVHAGCNKAMAEYVELQPVYDQAEGSSVTIEPGFDANKVRLSGNVVGDPPFHGILRHRGWRAAKIELPQRLGSSNDERIIAAAEVEIAG